MVRGIHWGQGFSGSQDLVPHAMDEQTALSHAAQVPPPVTREVFLSGTPDEVIDQAAEWRGPRRTLRGCRGRQLTTAQSRKGLAAAMPFARISRGVKRL